MSSYAGALEDRIQDLEEENERLKNELEVITSKWKMCDASGTRYYARMKELEEELKIYKEDWD